MPSFPAGRRADILRLMAAPHQRKKLTSNMERRYIVAEKDLPVSCPLPWTVLWNSHPRVYLPLKPGVDATCPYCGAVFSLATGEKKQPG